MNPQTMLEFVLQSNDLEAIKNYANFLSQKPEKWMFVPCDENGNVLEEPIYHEPHSENEIGDYQELRDQYQQALDRVIFEGFRMPYNYCFENKKVYFSLLDFDSLEQLINEHGDFLTLKKPIQ